MDATADPVHGEMHDPVLESCARVTNMGDYITLICPDCNLGLSSGKWSVVCELDGQLSLDRPSCH